VAGGIKAIHLSRKRNLDGLPRLRYVALMSRKPSPGGTPKAKAREDRLKAALKANLARRKAQAAARGGNNDKNGKAG
jgi:hypothetical protein